MNRGAGGCQNPRSSGLWRLLADATHQKRKFRPATSSRFRASGRVLAHEQPRDDHPHRVATGAAVDLLKQQPGGPLGHLLHRLAHGGERRGGALGADAFLYVVPDDTSSGTRLSA